jgi:hypothetical protein
MENVGLAVHTSNLKQKIGVNSLRDLVESLIDDDFIGQKLGLTRKELEAFAEMRATAKEILGPELQASKSSNPKGFGEVSSLSEISPQNLAPVTQSECRMYSLDDDFGSSDYVDLREPLRVTLDGKLKVITKLKHIHLLLFEARKSMRSGFSKTMQCHSAGAESRTRRTGLAHRCGTTRRPSGFHQRQHHGGIS